MLPMQSKNALRGSGSPASAFGRVHGRRAVGDPRSQDQGSVRLQLQATPAEVPLARASITRLCERLGLAAALTYDIRLAVTEACSNCALHAYDGSAGSPTYSLDARVENGALRIVVSDRGVGVDNSRGERDDGLGYGLRVIRQLASSSSVSKRPGGGTRVVMRFALPR
jgi:anti-sigma regulatory factor (Ser/Thr protein kinase)